MADENPYAAPTTDPTLVPSTDGEAALATPSERFGGAFIDSLILMVIVVPLSFLTGNLTEVEGSWAEEAKANGVLLIGIVIYMAIQWKFLSGRGQTIGKLVMKTRITTMDGRKPRMLDLVLKRYAFMHLIGMIPTVGTIIPLVDSLMVFRKDRRCLHDLIAGTQVVKVRPGEVIS